MAQQRFMLRIDDNKVYIYHPITVTLKNFVEITPAQAKNIMAGKSLMEGLSYEDIVGVVGQQGKLVGQQTLSQTADQVTELAYLKKKLGVALNLLGLSNPEQLPEDLVEGKVIMDDLEIPPAPDGDVTMEGPDVVEEVDPDLAMLEQIREDGKGKAKVESYILRNYGIATDPKAKLNDLVDMAVQLREKALEDEAAVNSGAEEPPEDEGRTTAI